MHARPLITPVLAAGALAALLGGCGSSSSGDSGSGTTQATQTRAASKAPAGQAVAISNFAFHPGTLNVSAGAKVTVRNSDSTAHTATADSGGFDTGDIAPGSSATVSLAKAGSFKYHCSIHPFMHGTLVVK